MGSLRVALAIGVGEVGAGPDVRAADALAPLPPRAEHSLRHPPHLIAARALRTVDDVDQSVVQLQKRPEVATVL